MNIKNVESEFDLPNLGGPLDMLICQHVLDKFLSDDERKQTLVFYYTVIVSSQIAKIYQLKNIKMYKFANSVYSK